MKEKGIALITTVLVFAILILSVGAVVVLARTENATVKNNERAAQAFTLAEAGIDWAEAMLRPPNELSATSTYLSLSATCSVFVMVDRGSTTATITSISTMPQLGSTPTASRAIRAVFSLGGGAPSPATYWKRPVTANGEISWFGNNMNVDATGIDGPAILSNSSTTNPSVKLSGNNVNITGGDPNIGYVQGGGVEVPWGSSVSTGLVTPDPVPLMDFAYWANLAKPPGSQELTQQYFDTHVTITGPAWVNSNLTITANNAVIYGPLYVNGTLSIMANTVRMNGVIYAKNNINLYSNNIYEPEGSSVGLTLVCGGSFTTGNNNINVAGIGGFAILAQQDVGIYSNTFDLSGLLYAGGELEVADNVFRLRAGALSVQGSMKVYNNVWDIKWVDPGSQGGSGELPPGMSGTGLTLVSWQEIALP